MLDAEVVVEQVDIKIGEDQLLLDELPDDAGHLVAVELDDGVRFTLIFAIAVLVWAYTSGWKRSGGKLTLPGPDGKGPKAPFRA
jgi:hypothetical protein